MNKKIAQWIWLIIIILFISMEVYHIARGNYDDVATSLLTVIAVLSIFGVYYLLRVRK